MKSAGAAIQFAQHVYRASRYSLFSTLTSDEPGRDLCKFDSSY